MQVVVYKNYVNSEICEKLNSYTLNLIENKKFQDGIVSENVNPKGSQMVSRFNKTIEFPDYAFDIRLQIQKQFNLSDDCINKQFHKDGIIVNTTFKNGQVVPHKDGVVDGFSALRCNLITSQPKHGGVLYVDNKEIVLNQGDLYTCLVSEYEHYVTKNLTDTPRIVWQFAFDVKKQNWGKYGLS
jgi:hypothetical protein